MPWVWTKKYKKKRGGGSGVITEVAWVAAVAQFQSLAQEFLHVVDEDKRKRKKKKKIPLRFR